MLYCNAVSIQSQVQYLSLWRRYPYGSSVERCLQILFAAPEHCASTFLDTILVHIQSCTHIQLVKRALMATNLPTRDLGER
jgi:hypothetical protein